MENCVYVFSLRGFCDIQYDYRYDPVPGVSKAPGGHYYKRMKTTQELRMYYAHKDEVRIRGKRKPHNLPSNYDDINISNRRAYGKPICWKRTKKKKQWM